MRNPYARRWMGIHRKYSYDDQGEMALARMEAQQAEDAGTMTCGVCSGTAYYRPGVGAYQCTECGALRTYNREWAGGTKQGTNKEHTMGNDQFKQGSGAYRCEECQKLTRDTGQGEAGLNLCLRCMTVAEYVNSVSDGDMALEDVPEEYRKDVKERL